MVAVFSILLVILYNSNVSLKWILYDVFKFAILNIFSVLLPKLSK